MTYKNILIAGALLVGGEALAKAPFQGGYAGVQVGVSHMATRFEVDFGNLRNDNSDIKLADTNIHGGLHFGWLFPYGERWVFGLEAQGNFSGLKAEDNSVVNLVGLNQVLLRYKEKYNAGLAAKAGYKVAKNALVYLKLGARLSEFETTYQDITNGNRASEQKQKKTKVGFESGLGATFLLNESWSAFGEYSYTFYGSNSFDNMDASGGDRFPTASIRPAVGRFTVGVSYHF